MWLKSCYVLLLVAIQSCSSGNVFVEEKVQLKNDCHYYIVHLPGCKEYNPWVKNTAEIDEFAKMVYDKYCPFCMTEDDVDMFDAISERNIKKLRLGLEEKELVPSERDMDRYYMCDLERRGYNLYYVYNDNTHSVEEYQQSVNN